MLHLICMISVIAVHHDLQGVLKKIHFSQLNMGSRNEKKISLI